ncbi:MAG: MBL fold metallo-hydrolase [Armatimonadetes bacterium]|nr:MBL fold metallo-hydrolase [Armatimonadota bacterium]NIM22820.1 MBL fold metallo-hydrolase [Armatimonadota bacterium]NIM66687.1 MBL fold metallo-hydrolase [Armatimonadota bacterium]NIM75244.1 MBL fold metallo-hydrolase [Armatimonadota bacterium]NIN04885.1 MBL fold metallo-hydrolase [Armatimonadota bacterium]
MKPVEIARDIYWVGALDPRIRRFDIVMEAPHGTTYNAYLVKGKEKTALIDLVKPPFKEVFFSNLESLVDLSEINYVILSHTEPDHSGVLGDFLQKVPSARVVAMSTAGRFIQNLLNQDINPLLVEDGQTLDLGGRRLTFIQAPFLHWPDTMLTHLEPDKILFTCDFLGCHYSDERLFDDRAGDFSPEFQYYFDCLFRPHKAYVLRALEKLAGREISMIATGHGPLLRSDPKKYMELYRTWSTSPEKTQKTLAIFYASAYGNTARMAKEIAVGAESEGVKAGLYDVVTTDMNEAVDRLEEADGVLVGSPTMNADAVKPVWDLLSSLVTIKVRGKVGGAFGSFAWSGEAPKQLEDRLKGLKFKVPLSAPRANFVPSEEDLQACRQFGADIAKAIKGACTPSSSLRTSRLCG